MLTRLNRCKQRVSLSLFHRLSILAVSPSPFDSRALSIVDYQGLERIKMNPSGRAERSFAECAQRTRLNPF